MQARSMFIALAFSIVGALPVQAATDSVTADALSETSWTLSAVLDQPAPIPGKTTMHFLGGKVHGTDGCNRYLGSYTSAGSEFKVGSDMVSTKMACPEQVMRQAANFMAALTSAAAVRLETEELTLLDAGGNALAAFTLQNNALGGTQWRVTGYNNGKQAVVSVTAGTDVTAEFKADGKLSGSAGCNRYTAVYTASGRALNIGPAATTRKSCANPPTLMMQEARFLKALATAATYRLDGDRLELRNSTGAIAITLSAIGTP